DPLIRRQMQDEFLRLQRVLHKTIVFITHDFLEALRVADRIAIMNEGQIVQLGTPAEVVMQPASDYVAEFTKDAPRAQVLTVADIAEPLSDEAESASPIPGTMSLDHVVRRIAQAEKPIAVADEAGKLVGQVTHQVVLQAMASADEAE
ncbi:MAG: glycine betaine/L-proline ABC transporter ATP-binding protein, partial [Proteobacteria bacterium]|nr:glycine betaine/L-proline ABC transporter ATP-binding protein [Pseudomonadota bacterium]